MATAIEVKERPILFSGPMVRAILEGRKTQTRRVMKPQPFYNDYTKDWFTFLGKHKTYFAWGENQEPPIVDMIEYNPYGEPACCHLEGDRLWVRETWLEDRISGLPTDQHGQPHYKANGYTNQIIVDSWNGQWKPSIFMPRWASRITLEITDIRVERVQQISEQDIEAEGTPVNPMGQLSYRHDYHQRLKDWQYLWDKINGTKPGYDWQSNPFVWVIEFKRINPEG